jgi:MFS family permease
MKKIAFVVAAASLFAFAPLAHRFGPLVASVSLVWMGILLALFASGLSLHGASLAIGAGALGALGYGVLGTVSPAVAGAVLVAAAFAERTTRIPSRTARAVHVLIALASGALAGSLTAAYTSAALSVFAVAAVVAAVLAALPLLVEADDPVAHALDEAASIVDEPSKKALREAAELRRQAADIPLDRATAARVRTTWQALLRLSEARVRLQRPRPIGATTPNAVAEMIDSRIAEHVSVLSRAYTAIDTVSAARIGVDDAALKNVQGIPDELEDVSRALVEVKNEAAPS